MLENEKQLDYFVDQENNTLVVNSKSKFSFDKVYVVDEANDTLWKAEESARDSFYRDPHINTLINGFEQFKLGLSNFSMNKSLGMNNITTIMAYGQSGAGKTYTISNLMKSVVTDLFNR